MTEHCDDRSARPPAHEWRAIRTPLMSSPFLDEIAGRKVLSKPECLQRTGSFKFRGGWSRSLRTGSRTSESAVSSPFSSGNHAQGVALAASLHGVPAVIIMPRDAPRSKSKTPKPRC